MKSEAMGSENCPLRIEKYMVNPGGIRGLFKYS